MDFWHVYVGLGLATAGYAALLEWLKRRYPKMEPDWTWAEVSVGTAIVLLAPYILEAAGLVRTAQDSRRAHWISFLIGGIPVIVWQVWRMSHRHSQIMEVAQEEATNGKMTNGKDNPSALADQSPLGAGGSRRARRRHQRPTEPRHDEAGESHQPDPEQP